MSNHQFIQAIAHILNHHSMGLMTDDECTDKCIGLAVDHLDYMVSDSDNTIE